MYVYIYTYMCAGVWDVVVFREAEFRIFCEGRCKVVRASSRARQLLLPGTRCVSPATELEEAP